MDLPAAEFTDDLVRNRVCSLPAAMMKNQRTTGTSANEYERAF
jgi:hypothetical protein